jgi:arabinogalactan oligomer / maltooligosaccharide transport system substrate-binding protein/arabinogalactan oligomer / maltooligosaccharide transport system permease protein
MIAAPLFFAAQVVLWHSYRADEQRGLDAAVAAWNQSHPDRIVEALAVPNDGFSYKLEAAIPRGHGPDLFIFSHEAVGEWSRAGLVAPIDDSSIKSDTYLDGMTAPLRIGGTLYGLPLAFKSLVLFYRTDLVPAPPATTDELLASCRTLSDPARGRYCLAYEAGSFYHHAVWLHGEGGAIFDREGRPHLATPEGIRALAFARSLVANGAVPDETTGTLVSELFNDGRAAYSINGPWFLGEIRRDVPYAVAPLPIVSATGKRAAPLLTIEAGLLSAHARNPAIALDFLHWLAEGEGARIRLSAGDQPVCARAAWGEGALPRFAALRTQLDSAVPMDSSPAMRAVWEPAQQALRRTLRGAADPEAALREADRRIAIALRPPPPASPPGPFAVVAGLLLLGGAALLVRRARTAAPAPRGGAAWAYLAPTLAAMVLLVFVPFAVGAAMSLFHHDGVTWRFVGLANFADILGSRDIPIGDPLSFYFTLAVTSLWTVANVALHVILGVTLALLLRDPLLKLRSIYRTLLIVPWAMPSYITALTWKGMFHRQFGAINAILRFAGVEPISWFARFWTSFTANLTTNVWLGFPFMMLVTLGALSRIPKELEEAAALDGASRWQSLRRVVLPLLRPQLLPSVILGAVWTFNMFNVVFLVSGGEPDGATDILISQAYRWAFTRGHRYGYAAAFAVLIVLVLVAQSVIARRFAPREEEG